MTEHLSRLTLTLEVDAPLERARVATLGPHLHGVLMESIPADYVQTLHTVPVNPYSQYALARSTTSLEWKISTLTNEARQQIVGPINDAPARGIVVTPALKEWSAAVHALLDGRQTVLLRKGGIGEKRFEVAAHEFLLFPTVAHSHAERVRPEHRDLLGPAAADSTDECVLLRAAAKVVAALPVNRPEGLDAIEDLHIWTAESVRADRLDFRPKHRLAVLVVCAIPLAEPVRLARRPEYGGCTSWVQLPVTPTLAAPVHDEAALAEVAARVREAVG
ncbi:CRISPR-associated endoribonuclease cas6 [Mycobacterium tuberculosis]|nr:CRISPR-associated endoribonuclease cas6 [Mycobacterium tuberculosis]